MTWISVEDRLPEFDKPVLVIDKNRQIVVATRQVDWWTPIPAGADVFPTHWAELPEGPGKGRGK